MINFQFPLSSHNKDKCNFFDTPHDLNKSHVNSSRLTERQMNRYVDSKLCWPLSCVYITIFCFSTVRGTLVLHGPVNGVRVWILHISDIRWLRCYYTPACCCAVSMYSHWMGIRNWQVWYNYLHINITYFEQKIESKNS